MEVHSKGVGLGVKNKAREGLVGPDWLTEHNQKTERMETWSIQANLIHVSRRTFPFNGMEENKDEAERCKEIAVQPLSLFLTPLHLQHWRFNVLFIVTHPLSSFGLDQTSKVTEL